jgi:hypothetical protein
MNDLKAEHGDWLWLFAPKKRSARASGRDNVRKVKSGRGIQDEVSESEPDGALLAKDALEGRLQCLKIGKRLIDVEDDQRDGGHVQAQDGSPEFDDLWFRALGWI